MESILIEEKIFDEYIENAQNEKGLLIWIENFKADHPVLTKRIPAIYNDEHGSIF
ncbi:hypothetical protein SAMN02745945_02061 [Peptoclostridium litorale DSM 5388]|uniref:Uncharacterized protein n=1 Tax=Peptoclostridium litorale DSM 5388 TaxID=1121324 RepID=A0A069RH47_PEPLI|nr:hypothetical protein [Peptoclostridium litorale]KDR95495.1 hypothetical protein CLIT_10c02220 [Peptoclostridium litorale DSM 5388]SIO17477.1 hypothetical protein SAMN02745945_02061 [Peptoclostridium litorale DSM 5388]